MFEDKTEWYLSEWNCKYTADKSAPGMSDEEIKSGKRWLRSRSYPKPADCPHINCPKFRPACEMGICNIAIGMCGDF